jgi:hypothetical protein
MLGSRLSSRLVLLSSLACLGSACWEAPDDPGGGETGGVYDDEEACADGISEADFTSGNYVPVEGCWRTVADASFDVSTVSTIRIGGPMDDDNYANRGDVELHYTMQEDRVIVQIKPFTSANSPAGANEDFERLVPWLYARENLAPPGQIPAEDSCIIDGVWQDACNVRVWYDGLAQKIRSGAHIRVFVPHDWRGASELATEDNLTELEDYPARGHVRVIDAPGSADITMEGGVALVRLADATRPVPKCSDAQNDACDAVGWDTEHADCLACTEFGRVHVSSRGGSATDIVVDAPGALWMNATLQNNQPDLGPATNPGCFASIDCEDFGGCEWIEKDPNTPWKRRAALNQPENALEGLGYNIRLESAGCRMTTDVDGPMDNGSPTEEVRGSLHLCSGCLSDVESPDPSTLY